MRIQILLLILSALNGFNYAQTFVVTERQTAAEFVVTDRNPWLPPIAEEPPQVAKEPEDTRPWINGYTASWCTVYCPLAKEELEKAEKDLPFRVKWIDVSKGGPAWCDSTPMFEWHTPDKKWLCVKGWVGVKELVSRWKASQTPKSRSPPK